MQDPEQQARPPLVLVVQDDEWAGRSIESILGADGYAILRARTGEAALELARRARPDAVISALRLGDMSGVELCRQLRESGVTSTSAPLIVVASGPTGRAQRLAAYNAGAWEFYAHPVDGEALLLKLRLHLAPHRELERLREESLVDPETGFYSLRGLVRRAREIGAEAQRRHVALACVVLGADLADRADDRAYSEAVAEHLGRIVAGIGRASDALGSLGAGEFGIVATEVPPEAVVRLFERVQAAADAAPLSYEGKREVLRLRAGYSAVRDFAEATVESTELLVRAASALRHLRHEGGDTRVQAYEELTVRSAP